MGSRIGRSPPQIWFVGSNLVPPLKASRCISVFPVCCVAIPLGRMWCRRFAVSKDVKGQGLYYNIENPHTLPCPSLSSSSLVLVFFYYLLLSIPNSPIFWSVPSFNIVDDVFELSAEVSSAGFKAMGTIVRYVPAGLRGREHRASCNYSLPAINLMYGQSLIFVHIVPGCRDSSGYLFARKYIRPLSEG